MQVPQVVHLAQRFVSDNAPAILTGVGIAGTVATAVLTGKASFKAAEVLHNETNRRFEVALEKGDTGLRSGDYTAPTKKEMVGLVWQLYLPAAGAGAGTIAAIFLANRISANRLAAVAAAYALTNKDHAEYREKVKELFGKTKDEKVVAAQMQDFVAQNPPVDGQIIIGDNKVLCLDAWSGRYFSSTMEDIKAAANWVNNQAINHGYASLTEWYGRLGLSSTTNSDELGWNGNELLEIMFTSALTSDDRPVLVASFQYNPSPTYARSH